MERTHVSSTNLRGIGFDPETRILEVEFVNGTVYQYQEVPRAEYDALMAAGSKGGYFNANIRKKYSCVKI